MISSSKKIFGRILGFAACSLVGASVSYLAALKLVYPLPPAIQQEASWLRARDDGNDLGTLKPALEGVADERHGFGKYERVALAAQIEIIEDGQLSNNTIRDFCKTLKWKRCESTDVQAVLSRLFGGGK